MSPAVLLVSAIVVATFAARPTPPAEARHPLSGQDRDAKALYGEFCKKCHGVLGTPPQTMKKKYSKIAAFDAQFVEKRSEDSITTVLTKGKGEDMEPVKDKMSAAEIRAVAKYVRELAARPRSGGD